MCLYLDSRAKTGIIVAYFYSCVKKASQPLKTIQKREDSLKYPQFHNFLSFKKASQPLKTIQKREDSLKHLQFYNFLNFKKAIKYQLWTIVMNSF